MKKNSTIFLLLSFISLNSQAQFYKNEFCAARESNNFTLNNKPWYGNNKYLEDYLDSCGYSCDKENVLYRIPVKFWIYRRSNKTGGLSNKKLKEFMNYLNQYNSQNNTGFRYYVRPDIRYIDKTRLYRLSYYREAPFQIIKRRSKGCINVLVPRNFTKYKLRGKNKHYNGTYNSIFKSIIVRQVCATATLAHEIGHFFGLEHPHRYCNKGKRKQESVSRTRKVKGLFRKGLNCEINGDAIADTPAEPDLNKYSNDECEYTGNGLKDNWGDEYKPAVNNIMSYTANRECRKKFTKGQIAVMLKTASEHKYAKGWSTRTSGSEKYDFDIYEPDNTKDAASEIFFDSQQVHTFHRVFAGNKKDLSDNIDWLFFKIKKTAGKNIIIHISKGKYLSGDLKIEVYKDEKLIKEKIIQKYDKKDLKFDKLKRGKYYLRIENLKNTNTIRGYDIKLNNT